MAKRFSRGDCLKRLAEERVAGRPILLWGAGSGLSAVSAAAGGADLIAVYSTAILRMKGLPSLVCSLPYSDANALLREASREILPLIHDVPLLAGIGAHDPLLDVERFLDELISMGYTGVINEPFASSYGSYFAAVLEEGGLGFSKEVELVRCAHRKGMLTLAWCTNAGEAKRMAEAGADLIGAMVLYGPTSLDDRSEEQKFRDSIETVTNIVAAAKAVKPDILVLTHGSPFMDVKTARLSLLGTGADGYAAGSSGERLSARDAMKRKATEYKMMEFE